jgi:23S rRNA (adenine2503-C2)-methyltransferase
MRKMKIIAEYGRDDLAKVYVARMRDEGAGDCMENSGKTQRHVVEFVESLQPPYPREKKQVVIVSSLFGCPVKCKMCDAGGEFHGKLTAEEILQQVNHVVQRRFPGGKIGTEKFKIQFARMGEPSLNPAVLDVMNLLPELYCKDSLNVSLSTIAPSTPAVYDFFNRLMTVKDRHYSGGRFQLQFSLHTTDDRKRDELVPVKKWTFTEISEYGERFCNPDRGDRKITLNFAPVSSYPLDAAVVRNYFDPGRFLIKLTPLNPTVTAGKNGLVSGINPLDPGSYRALADSFESRGFETIISIGELEENRIGSNCGQYLQKAMEADPGLLPAHSYDLEGYKII